MASFPVRLEQSAPPPVAYFESLFDSFRKEVRDNDMNQPEVTKPTLPCSTQAPPPNPSPPPSQPPASTSTLPPNQNIVTCLECDPQTEALQSLSSVSPTLSKEMDKVISEEYDRKLGEKQRNLVIQVPPPTTPPPNSPPKTPATLKSLHRTSSSTRSSSTSTLTALTSRTSLTLESVLLKISQNDSLYTRRLKNQNDSVSRRLRELIYECVGEFSKAHNRSLDRADYLSSRVVKSVKSKEQDLAWSIFGCRLEHEARK